MENKAAVQKISVIGNAGGGKTILSRRLAARYSLPVTHVDSIQFLSGMKIRPHQESILALRDIQTKSQWIIDGFGPLDILVERLKLSDVIVFIDLPIWRHFWWSALRQMQNIFSKRVELPDGCNEASVAQTIKLFKTIWQVHTKMRPEMKRILARSEFTNKVVTISTFGQFRSISSNGF